MPRPLGAPLSPTTHTGPEVRVPRPARPLPGCRPVRAFTIKMHPLWGPGRRGQGGPAGGCRAGPLCSVEASPLALGPASPGGRAGVERLCRASVLRRGLQAPAQWARGRGAHRSARLRSGATWRPWSQPAASRAFADLRPDPAGLHRARSSGRGSRGTWVARPAGPPSARPVCPPQAGGCPWRARSTWVHGWRHPGSGGCPDYMLTQSSLYPHPRPPGPSMDHPLRAFGATWWPEVVVSPFPAPGPALGYRPQAGRTDPLQLTAPPPPPPLALKSSPQGPNVVPSVWFVPRGSRPEAAGSCRPLPWPGSGAGPSQPNPGCSSAWCSPLTPTSSVLEMQLQGRPGPSGPLTICPQAQPGSRPPRTLPRPCPPPQARPPPPLSSCLP